MKKNLLAFLLLSIVTLSSVFAQSGKITGKVTGADDGQPIPGVTVKLNGTSIGVQTDYDGLFTISATEGQTLSLSFIGYSSQAITISTGNRYDI